MLGSAMDELLRHQPSLRPTGIKAIVQLMEQLVKYGEDTSVTVKTGSDHLLRRFERKSKSAAESASTISLIGTVLDEDDANATPGATSVEPDTANPVATAMNEAVIMAPSGGAQQADPDATMDTSHVDGDDANDAPASANTSLIAAAATNDATTTPESTETGTTKTIVPLLEYINNTMRFVEVVLHNQSLATSSAHAEEFASEGGLALLLKFYALPNLPLTFCHSSAANSLNTAFRALSQHMPGKAIEAVAEAIVAVDTPADSQSNAASTQPFSEALVLKGDASNTLLRRLCVVGRYSELLLSLMQHHANAQRSPINAFFNAPAGKAFVTKSMTLNKLLILQMGILTEEFHASRRAVRNEAPTTAPSTGTTTTGQTSAEVTGDVPAADAPGAKTTALAGSTDAATAQSPSVAADTLSDTSQLLQHLCQIHSAVVGVLSQLFRSNPQRRRPGFFGSEQGRDVRITDHVSHSFVSLVRDITVDKDAMEESAAVLLNLHHVSHIVGQLRLFMFDPPRHRSVGDRRVGKLNVPALSSIFQEGVFNKFTDVIVWMIDHLDPASHDKDAADKPETFTLLSKHELYLKCGQTAKSTCHKCELTICDVDLVYAHGGGAWVCNACDGQVEGRIAYHCGPCDYDICPPCFARREKKGDQRAYSKILQEALSLVAKVLELPQNRDGTPAPYSSSHDKKLMRKIRQVVAKTIGPLWTSETLARCDAEIIKSALHVIGHCLVAERMADVKVPVPTDTPAVSDNARQYSTLSETFQRLLAPSGHPSDASAIRSPSVSNASNSNSANVSAISVPFVADEGSVAMLTCMGFSVERASRALEMTRNDLGAATELILVGGDIDASAASTSQVSNTTRPDTTNTSLASDALSPISTAGATDASQVGEPDEEEDEEALLARAIAMSMAGVDDDDDDDDDDNDDAPAPPCNAAS